MRGLFALLPSRKINDCSWSTMVVDSKPLVSFFYFFFPVTILLRTHEIIYTVSLPFSQHSAFQERYQKVHQKHLFLKQKTSKKLVKS